MNKNLIISPVIIDSDKDNRNIINQDTSIIPDYSSFYNIPPGSNGFLSLDPRTFDSPRGMYLQLDRPPLYSKNTTPQIDLNLMKTNHIGFYDNYQSIYGGNIRYYTDLENDDPFSADVFSIPCYNQPTILIDPMGSHKPYYKRIPIYDTNPLQQNSFNEYSFLKDTSEFREDLIALQNDSINKSDFGYYQLVNDPKTFYPNFNNSKNYPLQ